MRKGFNRLSKMFLVLLVIGILMELSYRYYVIDFYQPEFEALNNSLVVNNDNPNILFFGDSFTANEGSYVGKMRKELRANLINSAISGTGVMEASFMASSRIRKYNPDVIVYQLYLGNDLLDVKHRTSGEISFSRRIYHFISDHFRIVKFINYRLAQTRFFFHNELHSPMAQSEVPFSPELYSARQKMLFKAEPKHLENVFELKNGRDDDLKTLIDRVSQIKNLTDEKTDFVLLIIPHCAQVNDTYFQRMKLLGSESSNTQPDQVYTSLDSAFPEIEILDVRDLFNAEDSTGHRLYYENDPHLNDDGQAVLAGFVKDYLHSKVQSD